MLNCKDYAEFKKEYLKMRIDDNLFIRPHLVVIQIGDNAASNSYIKGKQKDCEEVGIEFEHIKLDFNAPQDNLEDIISALNARHDVDGIILQLPVPEHIDVKRIQKLIDPAKDVDGFNPESHFQPCTPLGVINYLKYNGYEFRGKNACVIGRSDIVGKPLAKMLLDLDCTVTICHSKSDLDSVIPCQDIIFTCIDKIEFFDKDFFAPYQDVIDIGLGRGKDGKLHGNLTTEAYEQLCKWKLERQDRLYTDIFGCFVISGTGGVGLLTRLELLNNTFQAMVERRLK